MIALLIKRKEENTLTSASKLSFWTVWDLSLEIAEILGREFLR